MAKRKKNRENKSFIYIFLFIIFTLFILYFNAERLSDLTTAPNNHKTKIKVKKIEAAPTLSDTITKTAGLLKIPDSKYKSYNGNDAIYIRMGINGKEIDLNYANMILTGHVEQAGGKVITGNESSNGNKQTIEFLDPADSQKYIVTLYYADPSSYPAQKTKIAIVVDDFGYNNGDLLNDFCNLNTNITFSILPHLKYSQAIMQKAIESGHEAMIHAPMEPVGYPRNDPGPDAIYIQLSEKEIKKRMESYIKQLSLCTGINNHMGSLATADKTVMKSVMEVIKEHNLYFIDSRTSQSSIAYKTARKMMISTMENSLFLDTPRISPETLENKINTLQSLRKKHDKLVVITHCTSREHYKLLKDFTARIEELDFELVPASMLFKNNLPEIL